MSTVKFLTLNVRGLRNQEKRRSIFSYLKRQKANIYLLQETFSNEKNPNNLQLINKIKMQWKIENLA